MVSPEEDESIWHARGVRGRVERCRYVIRKRALRSLPFLLLDDLSGCVSSGDKIHLSSSKPHQSLLLYPPLSKYSSFVSYEALLAFHTFMAIHQL